jgi:crotonobetainyl-CoA:carnitine CoA-transferase CaiB-like acyl-CoA transferase
MQALLSGIRVVDLTTIVLGPYATQVLGDLGADVIKIESPNGDLFRSVRPGRSPAMGAGYVNCNRNKRSVALDLARPEGVEALAAIIATADVVVHNMRPKSLARIGASYEQAAAIKPDIVYCYAPGFGQDGPYAAEPAYDDIIQAASGVARLNANAQGEPRFLPTIVCDKVGGLHLAIAVLAGLAARGRTGKGACIEAPMFESMVSILLIEQLAGQSFRPPLGGMGYDRLLSPNRRPFRTKDDFISLLPYNSTHWERFLVFIGRADIAKADWVQEPAKRSENVDRLYQIVADAMPDRTTDEWLIRLRDLDIPCSRVNHLMDLMNDEHLQEVGMFVDYEHPTEGAMRAVRSPVRVVGAESHPDLPATQLGQNTIEVLAEVGVDRSRIDQWIRGGVAAVATTTTSDRKSA